MKLKQLIIRKGWLLTIPLLFSTVCFAQSIRFSEFYDASFGGAGLLEGVVALDNGSLIATGNSVNSGTGYRQGHIVLVDENGILLDESTTGHSLGQVNSQAILKSTTGSIYESGYICNSSEGNNYCDFYFSKINPETTDTIFRMVYSRPDTGDLLLNMVQTTPNRILLIGWTYNDVVTTNADLLFITVDTLGNELNRVVYGGAGTDYVHSGIVVNHDGDVLMTGYTRSFGGGPAGRTWILRTDNIGTVQWHKVYSGVADNGTGLGISSLPDGNFIVCGGNEGFGGPDTDGMLLKVDIDGNEIWSKEYPIPDGQGLWSVAVNANGSIVSCGVTAGPSNSQAGWLIKTDENGDTLWTRTYDSSTSTDYLRNMLVLDNGDIVMVGFGRGENSTNQDGWILRVDSLGCLMEGCSTVGVEELPYDSAQGMFSAYPNPFTNSTTIAYNLGKECEMGCMIRLYDLQGRVILEEQLSMQEGKGQFEVDMSRYGNGIYYCSLYGNKQLLQTEKLILMR